MKKNDLKYDPFREKALKLVENITHNLTQYLMLVLFLITVVTLSVIFSNKTQKPDLLQCLDSDLLLLSDSIKEYCEDKKVQDTLAEYKNKKASTIEETISLFYEIKNIPKKDRLEKLNSVNISNISNSVIKSKLYKIKGDLMLDEGLFLESVDIYLKADKSYNDNKNFSGLLFYKISQAYFSDFNKNKNLESLNTASNYISQSLTCKISNDSILEAIEILAARINHEI